MNLTMKQSWLSKLNNNTPTPFLAIDTLKAQYKSQLFSQAFSECQIYYAIKSFGDAAFLKNLIDYVDGFDVASWGECEAALATGASAGQILFSNPVKKPEHIQKAYQAGVRNFAFDSINELTKLAQLAPGSRVYIRVKVYDHGSAFPLSSKFGAQPVHIVPLLSTAIELGLKPVGMTFHVGSQSESLQAWDEALEVCGSAMERLEKIGIRLEFVNIGGGFPVMYTSDVPDIFTVVEAIRSGVTKYFPYVVELKAEPGRFIAAEAGVMVATVIGREHRGESEWLFTDVGTFNGLMESLEMERWAYPIFTSNLEYKGKIRRFTLTGPTCDPADTFGFDVRLPSNTTVGDRIFIGNAGAYTVVYSSSFNGFEQPEIIYLKT